MKGHRTRWPFSAPLTLIVAAILAWLTYPYWLPLLFSTKTLQSTAQHGAFGDAFGALNTLFSALAFGGIALSLVLQGRQFDNTQKEQQRQADLARIQQFESTFFQLLSLHNSTINSLEIQPRVDLIVRGRAVFEHYYQSFESKRYLEGLDVSEIERIDNAQHYLLFFNSNSGVLRQHVAMLRQICRFISRSAPSPDSDYPAFLRSQIAPHEAVLILLHCMAHPDDSELRRYVCEFALLENILDPSVLENQDIRYMPAAAYGANRIHTDAREDDA